MGCAHSRKKKCASKSGDSNDQTADVNKENGVKREVLDENIKQNVFDSRNNLRVDETSKLVFRKRYWRYEDKGQEVYPDFLNPFESEDNDDVSTEAEENENNDQDENILDYPVELNPFPSTDDEDSIDESEIIQEENENSLQDENNLDYPIELNPFPSTDDEVSIDGSEIIQEENENLKETNKTEYQDSMIPFDNEIINEDCNTSDIHVPVGKEDAEEDFFLVVPSTSRVKSFELKNENSLHLPPKNSEIEESGFEISKYDEDMITSKKESLENNFNNLENVGVMIENGENKSSFDVGTSSNSKDIITINISQVVSNKTPNILSPGIKDKKVTCPAPPPPCSELFPSENKTIPEKVTSTPMKKDIQIKIARKAPPPPGSRIKACVLNDCTDSTADLPEVYRNLRPLPSPPSSSELFPSENKTIPEKVTSPPMKKDIERKIARKAPPPPGSRIKACVLNDCTAESTAELPKVYRNIRPDSSPPMRANHNIDTTLQTKLVPDNDYGRKPRRKSLLDLFKVKKKKKTKD